MKKTYISVLLASMMACGRGGEEQLAADDAALSTDVPAQNLEVDSLPLQSLQLPEGFKVELFATGIEDARSLARGDEGTIFVGNRSKDKVWALKDANNDGVADGKWLIAEGLTMPNGVAFRDGDLYVAEVNRILRYPNIESQLDNPPQPEVVYDQFPTDRHHGWKNIAFGPDGMLYVPVGAPCNICESEKEIYATISRINPTGGEPEVYAKGVRNSVGFDWHPVSGELWFTDNGGDNLGTLMANAGKLPEAQAIDFTDNNPPDELNRAPKAGLHFGYPYCHAGEIIDPEFGKAGDCERFVQPVAKLDAHGGALGMEFYTGSQFPEQFQNNILIAQHGSWNRTKKSGYRVLQAKVNENGEVLSHEPFISGWLNEETQEAWGRPVDLLVMPDGSMLISDDYAGAIYRVSYDR